MNPLRSLAGRAVLALAALAPANAQQIEDPQRSAGIFTSAETGAAAYSVVATVLEAEQRGLVSAGRRMFNEIWVLPTEYTGVWGVGPTFNENSCLQCHPANGRARAPDEGGEVARGMLLRVSVPGKSIQGGPLPHPHYGDQIQNRGVKNLVPGEARAIVHYRESTVTFADGEIAHLRRPEVSFLELNFGELGAGVMLSSRIAPSLIGLGLLEAVDELTILDIAKQQSAAGFKGTPNFVWDVEQKKTVLGRFGWKANQPSLRQQVAAAFHGDIGATSELFPAENCPEIQTQCLNGPTATGCGGGRGACQEANYWEVLPSRLRNVTLYVQALAVPARRNMQDPQVRRGEMVFEEAKCAKCHVPEIRTGAAPAIPAMANQTLRAYTDLLLHDMGEELADHRPDYLAGGRQWRTPPLWALGLQPAVNGHGELLHDGRARSFSEAILWHGGEAEGARAHFLRLPKADRDALIRFLEAI